jgi:hypothetical protein
MVFLLWVVGGLLGLLGFGVLLLLLLSQLLLFELLDFCEYFCAGLLCRSSCFSCVLLLDYLGW